MTPITTPTRLAANKQAPTSGLWDMTMRFFGAAFAGKSASLSTTGGRCDDVGLHR